MLVGHHAKRRRTSALADSTHRAKICNVGFWPEADVNPIGKEVCFQEQTGHDHDRR